MSITLGLSLAAVSALFKSAKSITTKMAATSADSYLTGLSTRVVGVFVFFVLVLLTEQYCLPKSTEFWLVLSVNSALLGIVTILFVKAFEVSDVSIVSPIMALLPVFVTLPAFFILGEIPSIRAGLGLILVCIGAYSLNISSKNKGYLEPIRKISTNKGVQFAFVGVIIAAAIPSLDKIGIEESNPFLWVLATHIGSSIFIGSAIIYRGQSVSNPVINNARLLVSVGIISSLIWIFQSYAYTFTQVAYVQGIKRASILISVLAGHYIFSEDNIRDRLLGASIMLVGIILIVSGA